MGDALRRVRESGCNRTAALAFAFLVLTAARSGEVRGMRWSEVQGDTWTVPGERMKGGREHRVPLSGRALETLNEARELADGSGFVFPSTAGTPLADATLSHLCKELELGMVPTGRDRVSGSGRRSGRTFPVRSRRKRSRT